MPHFDITRWSDFARDLVDSAARREMRRHLEAGCRRCEGILAQIHRVVLAASSEEAPPEGAVRSVKAYFGLHASPATSRWRRLTARLAYDSALAPVAAGTRGHQDYSRHLVYNARDFTLDVRLDYSHATQVMNVAGQLLQQQGMPVHNAPTFLISGDRLLSRTLTGPLGEFHMECRPDGTLKLCFSIDERDLIEVELDERGSATSPTPGLLKNPTPRH